MRKILISVFAFIIFLNLAKTVNALSIHIEPWFAWTIEFDRKTFPGALSVIELNENEYQFLHSPKALINEGYNPIYITTKSCCEQYPDVPKGYYPRWKLINHEVYEFTSGEYKKLDKEYLAIDGSFWFYHNIKLADLVIKDNRPENATPPEPQTFAISTFYEGKQYNISGKIVYSLNPKYKEGAAKRAGEAAKKWSEENRKYQYFPIAFVLIPLTFLIFIGMLIFNFKKKKK